MKGFFMEKPVAFHIEHIFLQSCMYIISGVLVSVVYILLGVKFFCKSELRVVEMNLSVVQEPGRNENIRRLHYKRKVMVKKA